MIGLLILRIPTEGPIRLAYIIVGDHRLVMIALIVNLSGGTMTIAAVVHHAAMKTTQKSRSTQERLVIEIAVIMIIVCNAKLKMCAIMLTAVTATTRLNGNSRAKGTMTPLLAARALMLLRIMTGM